MDDLGEGEANKMTANAHRKQKKKEVCEHVLAQLSHDGHGTVVIPRFAEELEAHFNRLPTCCALDVHIDRAEDVVTHKCLLEEAKLNKNRAAFHLRAVHIYRAELPEEPMPQLSSDEDDNDYPIFIKSMYLMFAY